MGAEVVGGRDMAGAPTATVAPSLGVAAPARSSSKEVDGVWQIKGMDPLDPEPVRC